MIKKNRRDFINTILKAYITKEKLDMGKKIIKIIIGIVIVVSIPILMDVFILGNNVPSNIGNDVWADFLGSYIGGIATLLAVFITISDNNKKIQRQKIDASKEQRRLSIKPYLVTLHGNYTDCD